MAKFDKAQLLAILRVKREERITKAKEETERAKGEFNAWKEEQVAHAEAQLKAVKAYKFEETSSYGYRSMRPVPVKADTHTIDAAIAQIECMAGDVVQLNPTNDILGLL